VATSRCGQGSGRPPRPAGPVLDCAETYRRSARCQPRPL